MRQDRAGDHGRILERVAQHPSVKLWPPSVKSYKRIMETPFGTTLNFGYFTDDENIVRLKWSMSDNRVFLYALYRFVEKCNLNREFNVSYLFDESIERDGVSPVRLFGLYDEEELRNVLLGLSARYPNFINATYTNDLQSISLRDKSSFYDQTKRKEGLIAGNDFVTLDEVQTISFTDTDEMRAALKGYLEQGNFTVGDYKGVADAGVVLCGNIRKEIMDADGYSNMFTELPVVFHESALIERFHGFIKGWNIPRMNDDLKVDGWALNSEYFCSIMHELRSDMTYRTIVDELIIVPEGADTRDTEAVKRISTAYLKLLFPNVQKVSDIEPREFKRYCLDRARKMRDTIKYQLGLLDVEYSGKDLPAFSVKGLE